MSASCWTTRKRGRRTERTRQKCIHLMNKTKVWFDMPIGGVILYSRHFGEYSCWFLLRRFFSMRACIHTAALSMRVSLSSRPSGPVNSALLLLLFILLLLKSFPFAPPPPPWIVTRGISAFLLPSRPSPSPSLTTNSPTATSFLPTT